MNAPVRLGVVGAGSIAQRCHFPHLALGDVHERVTITAVCDPVLERAEASAAKYGIPAAYSSLDEMLESGNVDAVSLCSPIGFHFEQGMQAIERGVHVHFNKTMTTTVAEADALIERARAMNVKLVASPGEMLRPRLKRMKELVDEGTIGTPTWGATGMSFGTYHEDEASVRGGQDPLTNINPSWYFRRPGGGPLFDMAVYGLHAITGIFGPAQRVTAFSGVRIKERVFAGEAMPTDMDDNTFLVVDFGDSLCAFVYGAAAGELPQMGRPMIFGTAGTFNGSLLNGEPFSYPGMELDAEFGPTASLPHVLGAHRTLEEAHVFEDVMQLVDLILDDKPTLATPEHARHVIDIIESAYRSAESGEAQSLHTTF
jgi:predicted dehydrogenase